MLRFHPSLWLRRIEAVAPERFIAGSAVAIVATGAVDHFTGPIVSLAIIYLVPVAATGWVVSRNAAHLLALFAAVIWAVADRVGPLAEPKAAIAYLNDLSMLVVFLFIAAVVSRLRGEVQRQRDLLQQIQRHLLPSQVPLIAGTDIASRWIPAWTVAGDYYDAISVGDGRVAVCLADVAGKGMPAALIMSNVQATVRALAGNGLPPDRMLSALNALLYERLRTGSFVTMFFGVLDTENGTMAFASAGHPAAILRRAGGDIVKLESTGPVAGVFAGASYRAGMVVLAPGDCLVAYSDGITEYENARGEQFGERRLIGALLSHSGGSAEETCAALERALRAFGGARPWTDDVTMLVVRYTGARPLTTPPSPDESPSTALLTTAGT